jgi:integrase/recombinase XerD
MHVFFDAEGRPFLLDGEMRWPVEANAFLARISVVNGKTRSPKTWRSYAYQFADWIEFCARAGLGWQQVTELDLATYRNILSVERSRHTGRALTRDTINYKLSVVTQFYRFAKKKGWIDNVPFGVEETRIPSSGFHSTVIIERDSLRLMVTKEEIDIPSRQDIRRFIASFKSWRDRLIAETMWLTGMRCAEVCSLPLEALPESPVDLEKDTVAVKIVGKGQRRRVVLFPVRLLRSLDRWIVMERREFVARVRQSANCVFVGRRGKPLQTAAVNGAFSTNRKRTSLRIRPHQFRHAYAVERLAYLQDVGAPNPLKTVQMELGHAHMSTTERYLHLTDRMRSEVIEGHNSFVDRLLEG